ncbi:hydroxyacylglutathione hydrolase [Aliikangiella sp. IMCC44359]|uniref:hydroxyacylglutathione hydrolase n=1 Tax=Aliikangiella sp. IMCC44359 TaxID=3459125 RepID=UPI00403AD7E0
MIAITPITAFNDNYHWLIHNDSSAIVIDPGDPHVVDHYLLENSLQLVAILITHHHWDHIDGVEQLKTKYSAKVFGPDTHKIANIDVTCIEAQKIYIEQLELTFQVLSVPGHTLDHIAYFAPSTSAHFNLLFCGDTLFSGGCGRLFEGTPEQMWHSIQKLMALPESTQVYPAHEYTLDNLKFAQSVDPNNQELKNYTKQVQSLRKQGQPSLPTSIGVEKQVNPFMRVLEPSIIKFAQQQGNRLHLSQNDVFAAIRHSKDKF